MLTFCLCGFVVAVLFRSFTGYETDFIPMWLPLLPFPPWSVSGKQHHLFII